MLHRHAISGQSFIHAHPHPREHGYYGHPEDAVKGFSVDGYAEPNDMTGTYEKIDTDTVEGLRLWFIHVCGADPTCTMIRRDQVQVGDVVHSSHFGRRKVTAAHTRGTPTGTTTLSFEGIDYTPEAYPADSLIPLVARDHACARCGKQIRKVLTESTGDGGLDPDFYVWETDTGDLCGATEDGYHAPADDLGCSGLPDEGTCPSCQKPRPLPVNAGGLLFVSGSTCPGCGHVEPDFDEDTDEPLTPVDAAIKELWAVAEEAGYTVFANDDESDDGNRQYVITLESPHADDEPDNGEA